MWHGFRAVTVEEFMVIFKKYSVCNVYSSSRVIPTYLINPVNTGRLDLVGATRGQIRGVLKLCCAHLYT